MDNERNVRDLEQMQVTAAQHPRLFEPGLLLLNLVLCVLGCIIGLELMANTGTTPNTSLVGALIAIIISRIPIARFMKLRSIHRQNLIQTSISGATFAVANCMFLTVGVPILMGRSDLMIPMLIGVTLATVIDATILYKCFDTPMFPAEGAWPPGVATAETLLAVVNKGRRALLLLVGMGMGVVGKMIGLPMDLLGVSWFGNFAAMMGLGVGSLVIGSVKTNAFGFKLFGHSFVLVSDMFGAGFDTSHLAITYLGHGLMIGAGMVSLIQAARMLMQKDDGESSAASRFTSSMKNMRNAMGLGYIAYAVVALGIAIVSGLLYEMSIGMFVAWILFAAVAALVSEIMVGIAAMHSGWFPGFATAFVFLIIGMLIGFPALPLGILVAYTASTGPCFSDMGYDLKTGYILRGNGKDKELELFGRKQQWYAELLGFAVAFIMMAFFANNYFGQEMFAPVSKTYVSTIAAGTTPEIAKWLLIWAVPGAIIQWVFGHRQVGILFATGILVGNTLNGLTILLALLLRYILEKRNEENRQILTILGAGALAGSALYSFFTATLGLAKKK
mgnify:FL=1